MIHLKYFLTGLMIVVSGFIVGFATHQAMHYFGMAVVVIPAFLLISYLIGRIVWES